MTTDKQADKCQMIPPRCTCDLVPPFHDGKPCPVHGLTKPTKWPANIVEITNMLPDNMQLIAKERLAELEEMDSVFDEHTEMWSNKMAENQRLQVEIAELQADRERLEDAILKHNLKILRWFPLEIHMVVGGISVKATGKTLREAIDKARK